MGLEQLADAGGSFGNRKDIATSLHRSEKTVVALLQSASQAIISVDREGRIVLANSRTEEMFGYPQEELLGSTIEVLLPEAIRDGHMHSRTDYFAHPRVRPMGIGMDLSGRRKDGSDFPATSASENGWKNNCSTRKRWRPSAGLPVEWRTTSTTCSP